MRVEKLEKATLDGLRMPSAEALSRLSWSISDYACCTSCLVQMLCVCLCLSVQTLCVCVLRVYTLYVCV
jgi:hypothetical protein